MGYNENIDDIKENFFMDAYFHYQISETLQDDMFFELLTLHLQIPYTIHKKSHRHGYILVENRHMSDCSQFFQSLTHDLYYNIMVLLSYGDDSFTAYIFSIFKKYGFYAFADMNTVIFKALLTHDKNISKYLDNLFSCLDGDEIQTVEVFIRDSLNAQNASEDLYIHRNTLRYRLQAINDKTGLDMHSFENAQLFDYWRKLSQ